jgi:hypothetical protein
MHIATQKATVFRLEYSLKIFIDINPTFLIRKQPDHSSSGIEDKLPSFQLLPEPFKTAGFLSYHE